MPLNANLTVRRKPRHVAGASWNAACPGAQTILEYSTDSRERASSRASTRLSPSIERSRTLWGDQMSISGCSFSMALKA
jgi:hypothetical protein